MVVIACLKEQYERKIARREIDLVGPGHTTQLYKLNLKEAGIWVNEMWNQSRSKIIYNCWWKTQLV